MPVAAASPESPIDRRRYPEALAFFRWQAADGWPHRAYRWPPHDAGKPRGSVLFQSGRADFIEKYLEPCDHWWRAGWGVEGFDWRGQGGSGRLAADNVDHRDSLDPLIDDLAAYVAEWRARTPAPHVVIGHSMGGHVALGLCAERGVALDALVLVAPMLELETHPVPRWLARPLVWGMTHAGFARRIARDEQAGDPRRQARLTADRARYADSQWWKTTNPALGLGGPSWGWLAAAMAGERRLMAPALLEAVHTPVLLLEAGRDRLVSASAIAEAARRLPDATLKTFPTAAHELLREADANRLPAMAAIDAFLDARAPAA